MGISTLSTSVPVYETNTYFPDVVQNSSRHIGLKIIADMRAKKVAKSRPPAYVWHPLARCGFGGRRKASNRWREALWLALQMASSLHCFSSGVQQTSLLFQEDKPNCKHEENVQSESHSWRWRPRAARQVRSLRGVVA